MEKAGSKSDLAKRAGVDTGVKIDSTKRAGAKSYSTKKAGVKRAGAKIDSTKKPSMGKKPSIGRKDLLAFLDAAYLEYNSAYGLEVHLDPINVAHRLQDFRYFDSAALVCALFAYGSVRAILGFLEGFPFHLLDPEVPLPEEYIKAAKLSGAKIKGAGEKGAQKRGIEIKGAKKEDIKKEDSKINPAQASLASIPYYRFQSRADVANLIILLREMNEASATPIADIFLPTYRRSLGREGVIAGIYAVIDAMQEGLFKNSATSKGLDFLVGKNKEASALKGGGKRAKNTSPLKRFNMFLRWMVRRDFIDFGRYAASSAHLILPLDTHTFTVCKKLGLCSRASYDIKAALEISDALSSLCKEDPIRYDFALYRIGQLGRDAMPKR